MKHEYESDWKQLGSLANGVLRSVEEKRRKQAEFFETVSAAPQHPPADGKAQLDLPLFRNGRPDAAYARGRFAA